MRRWTDEQLVEAVKNSQTFTDVIKKIGLRPAGGTFNFIRNHMKRLKLDYSHFSSPSDRAKIYLRDFRKKPKSIDDIFNNKVECNTTNLKERLYKEGYKKRVCELCGQGELWNGKKMSLIIDHINGNHYDNKLSNLQIVCPNCAATLSTHCSKKMKKYCPICGNSCGRNKKYCSNKCSAESKKGVCSNKNVPLRKVLRPTEDVLLRDVEILGYLGTGRRYGVSDNAIRKWIKFYKKENISKGI